MIQSSWPALPIGSVARHAGHAAIADADHRQGPYGNTPLINHWWNVPCYVTARGLTAGLMTHRSGENFRIDFDLRDVDGHELRITVPDGRDRTMALQEGPVRDFYAELMAQLDALGLGTRVWPMPVEIEDAIPFDLDDAHTAYRAEQARDFWLALVRMPPVFELFRGRFVGKASPVHLFWGRPRPGYDAVLRPTGAALSGPRAELRPSGQARGVLT